ncbi:MAG: GNAT family N-acetyltransferase [Acidimicrobiales bacterium]
MAALTECPSAFLSTLDGERTDPENVWRRRASKRALAWVGDVPVGMIGWSPHDGFLEIIGLWVHPDYRGRGAADALVNFVRASIAANAMLELRLAVMATNERAAHFYRRVGFVVTHEHDHPAAGRLTWMKDNAVG